LLGLLSALCQIYITLVNSHTHFLSFPHRFLSFCLYFSLSKVLTFILFHKQTHAPHDPCHRKTHWMKRTWAREPFYNNSINENIKWDTSHTMLHSEGQRKRMNIILFHVNFAQWYLYMYLILLHNETCIFILFYLLPKLCLALASFSSSVYFSTTGSFLLHEIPQTQTCYGNNKGTDYNLRAVPLFFLFMHNKKYPRMRIHSHYRVVGQIK